MTRSKKTTKQKFIFLLIYLGPIIAWSQMFINNVGPEVLIEFFESSREEDNILVLLVPPLIWALICTGYGFARGYMSNIGGYSGG